MRQCFNECTKITNVWRISTIKKVRMTSGEEVKADRNHSRRDPGKGIRYAVNSSPFLSGS
ncbi:MAG: hypothetical protein LWW85_01630 [Marinilabiliales bacterium]|nr:hypothetical protein [Marinilabiliales bacterium]